MEPTENTVNHKFIKVNSNLTGLDGSHKEISITLLDDGLPRAVAFFDIDKTLAELKDIHGQTIRMLFKEFFDKDFEGIEEVYFKGFRLGNSFREFDRMNGIYGMGHTSWIDPEVYIKERLKYHIKDIDSDGTEDHKIAKIYLDRYAELAVLVADRVYKENPKEFESVKIKPIFALAKLYKALGIPMFGMTANGRKFVDVIAKYLGLSEIFIDIATDEDMVGGGKEIIIPKLINFLEEKNIPISKEKLVIVGDSLNGDIGSGYRYKIDGEEIQIKGILVLADKNELYTIREQIDHNKDLKRIIQNTDTEAFILSEVPIDRSGEPLLFSTSKKNYLVKL